MPTPWTVPREWEGETAFIVGGGPSVAMQPTERLRGRNVIAINTSFELVPFAQYLFFIDVRWFRYYESSLQTFAGRIVTCTPCPGVIGRIPLYLKRIDISKGISTDPSGVVAGRTSTQGAINLAVLLGATRIVLIGIDNMALGGKTHHHRPHPWKPKPEAFANHAHDLAYSVTALKKVKVQVVNASPISRLKLWPKVNLEDEL